MSTISLFRKIQLLSAEAHGCEDCTMLEDWCNSVVQRPRKCKLDEGFLFCPMTGAEPGDMHEVRIKTRYLFVESENGEEKPKWKS